MSDLLKVHTGARGAVRIRSKWDSAGCLSTRASGRLTAPVGPSFLSDRCGRYLNCAETVARVDIKRNSGPSIEFTHIPRWRKRGRGKSRPAKAQIVLCAQRRPRGRQPWAGDYLGFRDGDRCVAAHMVARTATSQCCLVTGVLTRLQLCTKKIQLNAVASARCPTPPAPSREPVQNRHNRKMVTT